jgi:hypothetical protein
MASAGVDPNNDKIWPTRTTGYARDPYKTIRGKTTISSEEQLSEHPSECAQFGKLYAKSAHLVLSATATRTISGSA